MYLLTNHVAALSTVQSISKCQRLGGGVELFSYFVQGVLLTLIGPGLFYEQEAQEGVDSTPPMKTLFWPGMSCFDYIPPKIHIIGDVMQKFRIQSH